MSYIAAIDGAWRSAPHRDPPELQKIHSVDHILRCLECAEVMEAPPTSAFLAHKGGTVKGRAVSEQMPKTDGRGRSPSLRYCTSHPLPNHHAQGRSSKPSTRST
jgi:hypothetical protein